MSRFALILMASLPLHSWAAETVNLSADYTGYSHGLTVLKLTGTLSLTPSAYALHVSFHTAGLIGMVVHSDNDSTAYGKINGATLLPTRFTGFGHLRGVARDTVIDYVRGDPVIRQLSPPPEQERSGVDPAQTRGTIDTLSAITLLMRQVATTGSCGGDIRTFDGRRLAQQHAFAAGAENLSPTDRSMFSGSAIRCNLEGQQLAGFVRNEDEKTLRKPRYGTVWFAPVTQAGPPIPVKISFENQLLGPVTLYLTAVYPSRQPAIAQCCGSAAPPMP